MPDPLTALLIAVFGSTILVVLFWPGSGLVSRWRRGVDMTERVFREDALKFICKCEAMDEPPTLQSVAGSLNISSDEAADILRCLEGKKLVRTDGQRFRLTEEGRQYALNIIRAHRLWERYLADETGFAQEEWHTLAERAEHRMSPDEVEALADRLGRPTHDPHGDPIPTPTRGNVFHGGRPLNTIPPGTPVRIVHLEDEPEAVYAQLVAVGLQPGMTGLLTESTEERVRFWTEGNEHLLAPIIAGNVAVLPIPEEQKVEPAADEEGLDDLDLGESAEVIRLSHKIRGAERRRLMDLGILPGTSIRAELKSPTGDLTAYRVRGAIIALREEQAGRVHVRRGDGGESDE